LAAPALAAHPRVMPMMTAPDGAEPMIIDISTGHAGAQIVVPVGKSRLVRFDRGFRQVQVGSGDIAEVVPLSGATIYVLGKKRGATNLTILDGGKTVVAVVDVVVTYDIDDLRKQIAALVPGTNIDIQPAGDALILSGRVPSTDRMRRILAIADRYAPGAVTNLMSISGSQQVLLEVKFAEVTRSALVTLGLTALNGASGTNGITAPTASAAASAFGAIGGVLTDSKTFWLRGELNAMEQSGMVHTLAEPNVAAMSGETASFLAGGEFPIPVVQSSTGTLPTTTIEYKSFGVGLGFTPTVISSDLVNLVLKSEVSALDDTVSVTTNGITVPGLKVRRATTTVELHNGQTFAIAGLLQDDFSNSMNAIPGIGNIPILGALFRSTNFKHNQTELVVFITVHLVNPGPGDRLAAPTEMIVPPTPEAMIGNGQNEEILPPKPPAAPPAAASPEPHAENTPQAHDGRVASLPDGTQPASYDPVSGQAPSPVASDPLPVTAPIETNNLPPAVPPGDSPKDSRP